MNLLHLKYVVEVAKAKSINTAAESLYMSQPNLSRAIKDFEISLGVKIFKRSRTGIEVTPEGKELLLYAKNILSLVDKVETLFCDGYQTALTFSLCSTRAAYIGDTFSRFSASLDAAYPAEIFYKETDATDIIDSVASGAFNVGILRYDTKFEILFSDSLDERGLAKKEFYRFHMHALMSKDHPLAGKEKIFAEDLGGYTEIAQLDMTIPSLQSAAIKKQTLSPSNNRRIHLCDREIQRKLLSATPGAFMRVSPVPGKLLDEYDLVEKEIEDPPRTYKDVIIFRDNYAFSNLDNLFFDKLEEVKKEYL